MWHRNASVVQWIERQIPVLKVGGSSPFGRAKRDGWCSCRPSLLLFLSALFAKQTLRPACLFGKGPAMEQYAPGILFCIAASGVPRTNPVAAMATGFSCTLFRVVFPFVPFTDEKGITGYTVSARNCDMTQFFSDTVLSLRNPDIWYAPEQTYGYTLALHLRKYRSQRQPE